MNLIYLLNNLSTWLAIFYSLIDEPIQYLNSKKDISWHKGSIAAAHRYNLILHDFLVNGRSSGSFQDQEDLKCCTVSTNFVWRKNYAQPRECWLWCWVLGRTVQQDQLPHQQDHWCSGDWGLGICQKESLKDYKCCSHRMLFNTFFPRVPKFI